MFGYVNINKPELRVRENEVYQGYYCGLCQTLKKKYGRLSQLTLNYDMTFLVILLSALYECEERRKRIRCAPHPMTPRDMIVTDYSEYGADMTIVLSYFHLLDDWKDEHKILEGGGAKLLAGHYRKLKEQYPRQCHAVERAIADLEKEEKANSEAIDRTASYTGMMLREIFVPQQDVWTEQLQTMGMSIGKFIYLMDAYEDLEEDVRKGQYNPLRWLSESTDYEQTCETMLRLLMTDAATAFEKLPILMNAELLRNIIYAGVWVKHDSILMKKKEQENMRG